MRPVTWLPDLDAEVTAMVADSWRQRAATGTPYPGSQSGSSSRDDAPADARARGGDPARLRAAGPRQHGPDRRVLRGAAGRAPRPSRAGIRGGRRLRYG